jgi:uncharacterized protein (DUF1015 family)
MKILPFRGYRYNLSRIGKLDDVISPPYDQYKEGLDDLLYARHPFNIARIIMNKETPADTTANNRYTRSRDLLNQWCQEGIFVQDDHAAIYPYCQEYRLADHGQRLRKSFIALGEVTDYAQRVVFPHERTLSKPKQDRLNLMRATLADTGLVFMLYSDPEGTIEDLLDRLVSRPADMEALDLNQEKNFLWKVENPCVIEEVQKAISQKTVIIADGHHRYEVALTFRQEVLSRAQEDERWRLYGYKLMGFIRLESTGITIFPIHRLVRNVSDFDAEVLLRRLRENFRVKETEVTSTNKLAVAGKLLEDARGLQGQGENALVLYLPSLSKMALLVLQKDHLERITWPSDKSVAWRNLDISVLQTAVLERYLGIGERQLSEQSHLEYVSEFREALKLTDEKGFQCAFLLNATPIAQVKEVVEAGDLLPQKSTHFHPKLMEGLVFAKHV